MRVCVCGGRDYFNRDKIYDVLDYCYENKPFILVSGGATGADTIASQWANERDVYQEIFPANWKKHGRAAGPIRNKRMIKSGIDVLLAFPGGNGTADMMAQCIKNDVKVVEIQDESYNSGRFTLRNEE